GVRGLVVVAVGGGEECQRWMCGAHVAKVDLNRGRLPRVGTAYYDEVDGEASDRAATSEFLTDLACFAGDRRDIVGPCRQSAAEVRLASRSAEDLVVCAQDLDTALWTRS